jgi:hypothetical protein
MIDAEEKAGATQQTVTGRYFSVYLARKRNLEGVNAQAKAGLTGASTGVSRCHLSLVICLSMAKGQRG